MIIEGVNNSLLVTADDKYFTENSTGLIMYPNTPYDEWFEYGQKLGNRYSTTQWCIGDWINLGEAHFGEMYSQALDTVNFAYGTLRNYSSICARIPQHIRRSELKFHQQKHVAPLEPDEQKRILDFAVEKKLSGDDIQEIVRKLQGKIKPGRAEIGQSSDNEPRVIAEAIAYVNANGDLLYVQEGTHIQTLLRKFAHDNSPAAKVKITISAIDTD